MHQTESELECAWMELSFWRDFVVWWRGRHGDSPEPRLLEAVEMAERRYEKARQNTVQ